MYFLYKNYCILIQIWWELVPKSPVEYKPGLLPKMAVAQMQGDISI